MVTPGRNVSLDVEVPGTSNVYRMVEIKIVVIEVLNLVEEIYEEVGVDRSHDPVNSVEEEVVFVGMATLLIQLVGLLIARDDILAAVPLPARSLTVPL